MFFHANEIYHVYNRGNNKQPIYLCSEDYLSFLKKVNTQIKPNCDILAWCLMPNHFHFLISTNEISIMEKKTGGLQLQYLTEGIRQLLSSYTRSFNKKYTRTGNLFQQKTKAKQVSGENETYARQAFHYIHQNPWRAGMVSKIEDWEFSSFKDYSGMRNGKLCNMPLAKELLDLNPDHLYKESYEAVPSFD